MGGGGMCRAGGGEGGEAGGELTVRGKKHLTKKKHTEATY